MKDVGSTQSTAETQLRLKWARPGLGGQSDDREHIMARRKE